MGKKQNNMLLLASMVLATAQAINPPPAPLNHDCLKVEHTGAFSWTQRLGNGVTAINTVRGDCRSGDQRLTIIHEGKVNGILKRTDETIRTTSDLDITLGGDVVVFFQPYLGRRNISIRHTLHFSRDNGAVQKVVTTTFYDGKKVHRLHSQERLKRHSSDVTDRTTPSSIYAFTDDHPDHATGYLGNGEWGAFREERVHKVRRINQRTGAL